MSAISERHRLIEATRGRATYASWKTPCSARGWPNSTERWRSSQHRRATWKARGEIPPRRAVVLQAARLTGLPCSARKNHPQTMGQRSSGQRRPRHPAISEDGEIRSLEAMEADMIRLALGRYRGHMTEVAKRLKIGRSTLYRKMQDYGLEPRPN